MRRIHVTNPWTSLALAGAAVIMVGVLAVRPGPTQAATPTVTPPAATKTVGPPPSPTRPAAVSTPKAGAPTTSPATGAAATAKLPRTGDGSTSGSGRLGWAAAMLSLGAAGVLGFAVWPRRAR